MIPRYAMLYSHFHISRSLMWFQIKDEKLHELTKKKNLLNNTTHVTYERKRKRNCNGDEHSDMEILDLFW